jgi:hypothetical protein
MFYPGIIRINDTGSDGTLMKILPMSMLINMYFCCRS